MIFRERFRVRFKERLHDEPQESDFRAMDRVRAWADKNPGATVEECKAAMSEEYKSGSILITLTLLLVICELVYFIRAIRHQGEAGDAIDYEIAHWQHLKEEAVANQDFDKARAMVLKINELRGEAGQECDE